MSTFLRRLFSSTASPADGLTQPKREAIVDLLNFCMCADEKLLLDEMITIDDEIQGFSWDPAVDFMTFATQSRERAMVAVATPETRQTALASISDRLQTTEAKTNALDLCQKVFHSDGEYAPVERSVFQEIKHAFGWPA
jgi:tellurite resistance protein